MVLVLILRLEDIVHNLKQKRNLVDLYKRITQPNFQGLHQFSKMTYSALPHLGFAYSFGAQGTRFIHANYYHAFSNSLLLAIDYKKSNGAGVIRKSDFSLNDFGLQLIYSGKRYSTVVKGSFNLNDVSHSGGVLSIDSTIQQLGIEFADVQKGNARSKNKNAQIQWENYVNFLPDSIKQLGLKSYHSYTIQNRVYTEYSDTLSQLYPVINIHSDSTRDQYNLASITNGMGVYFSSKVFSVDGVLDYRYWDFQNLGIHSDTSELGIRSNARLLIGGLSVYNYLHFNLIGAANEFENKLTAHYKLREFDFVASYFLENKTQSPLQRSYFSNNTSYTNLLSKQTSTGVNVALDIDLVVDKCKIGFFSGFTSVKTPFLYDGLTWRNDSIDFSFASLGMRGAVKLGALHINPKVIYSISKNGYLPEIQALGRFYLKGHLFKAKKLEAVIGVDASYTSAYRLKAYVPYMDTYSWGGSQVESNPLTNLHAFLSLGIASS